MSAPQVTAAPFYVMYAHSMLFGVTYNTVEDLFHVFIAKTLDYAFRRREKVKFSIFSLDFRLLEAITFFL